MKAEHPLHHNVTTLAKLFSLDVGKLLALIEAEGVIAYDSKTCAKVGYIPTLASYFKLDSTTEPKAVGNTKAEWFVTDETNGMLTVTTAEKHIPVTAYLFSPMYNKLGARTNHSILLPPLTGQRLFIADNALIQRLKQGIAGDYTILPYLEGEGNDE